MKLSDIERKVLASLGQLGDCSVSELARRSGTKEHSARYAIRQLCQRKIIFPYTYISLRPLGYLARTITFSVYARDTETRQNLIQAIVSNSVVSWMAEFSGDFQFGCTIQVRTELEVRQFLDTLFCFPGIKILKKVVRSELALVYYPLKFFLDAGEKGFQIVNTYDNERKIIDDVDTAILRGLSSDGWTNLSAIARNLEIRETTLRARIENLKSKGIVQAFTYFLNPECTGLLSYKLLLTLSRSVPNLDLSIREFAYKHRAVSLLVHCAGTWDYEVNFEVANQDEANKVQEQFHVTFGDFLNETSLVQILRHIKVSNFPF
jgi:DNA-binding Lrp family transcriptional regulator